MKMWFYRILHKRQAVCVVPAAGSATRMNSAYGDGKQLILLNGKPLLVHTLLALEKARRIGAVVVVAKQEELVLIQKLVQDFKLKKVSKVVCGGKTRLESVARGIAEIPQGYRYVAIHDGARPLCSPELIDRVVDLAVKKGAALPGVPPTDTIHEQQFKRVAGQMRRERLIAVQTPQVFPLKEFDAAVAYALQQSKEYTDDASVYAILKKPIHIAEGDYRNIKVTRPHDVVLAELFLSESDLEKGVGRQQG